MNQRTAVEVSDQQVRRVHESALVIDGQGVAALLPVALIPQPPVEGRSYVQRARAGGMTAMNVTMGIGGIGMGVDNLRAMLNTIHGYLCYFEIEPENFVHVLEADDVLRAKRENKIGIIFGVQGIGPKIEDDANLILILHRLGLRIGQLTYNERGSIGCGALEAIDSGLTQFGQIVVREMNHVGMLVDLAHAGERTALDAIGLSASTVICSHANARALTPNARNWTDDMIRALAGHGGVLGISAYAPFCEPAEGKRPVLDDMVDHIAYVADLVGTAHVGIGSDFFEAESPVRMERFFRVRYPAMIRGYDLDTVYMDEFRRVEHLPRLTRRLLERGFSAEEVSGILGGNFQRVFAEVWT